LFPSNSVLHGHQPLGEHSAAQLIPWNEGCSSSHSSGELQTLVHRELATIDVPGSSANQKQLHHRNFDDVSARTLNQALAAALAAQHHMQSNHGDYQGQFRLAVSELTEAIAREIEVTATPKIVST